MHQSDEDPFAPRSGYSEEELETSAWMQDPKYLRFAVLSLAEELEMTPSEMRDITCHVLSTSLDLNDGSGAPGIWMVADLLRECRWDKVYAVAEALHARLSQLDQRKATLYEERLNEYFQVMSIFLQMQAGKVTDKQIDDPEGP